MLQDTPGTASPAAVEAPAKPNSGLQASVVQKNASHWQDALPTLSEESVSLACFCRICANHLLLQSLAQPESANGAKLFPPWHHILGGNVHRAFCIHSTFHLPLPSFMGVPQSLHKIFCAWRRGDHRPFSFTRILFSCKGGALWHHWVPQDEKRRVMCGGILSSPAPIPGLISLVYWLIYGISRGLMVWGF